MHNVHPAETFPLALACGAVLQQIIFVSVQGTTLHSVFSKSCRGLAMVTFPGTLSTLCDLRTKRLTGGSYFSDRVHHLGFRHRSRGQSLQTRPIRSTRQVEHNNMCRRRIVYASAHLDANCGLAIAKHLLWWPYLVYYAIRSSHVDFSFCSCLPLALGSRFDQYPTDENTRDRSQ